MRLWTLHPKHLDSKGLVALWREGLLALKVLQGRTRGYRHHPQLNRFKASPNPTAYIVAYLRGVHAESVARGYKFDASKLPAEKRTRGQIQETQGQLDYEWTHFLNKIRTRAPDLYRDLRRIRTPAAHPLFRIVPGDPSEGSVDNASR